MIKFKEQGYYVNKANLYIDKVLSGEIVACKWVKLACQRQKEDLLKEDFEYYFDVKKAERICRFAETIKHATGKQANEGKTLELELWQCFIYTTVFGWLNKKTQYRRFKDVYIEVARKNGKSFFSIPVALYMLCLDNEQGAQVFIAASHHDQTKHIWEPSLKIISSDSKFTSKKGLGLKYTNHSIYKGNNTFKKLVRDNKGSNDGSNPSCAIIDELHAHPNADTHNSIISGIGAREQPLVWRITTAGVNLSGICYDQHSYVKRILNKITEDESYFGIIYTIDDDDNYLDPNVWIKANPNLGVSVNQAFIQNEANKTKSSPLSLNNFKTKLLNVWVNSAVAWMDMTKFRQCADTKIKIEDYKEWDCYVGCDLASKKDFAAVSCLFTKKINNKQEFVCFVKHFLNSEAIQNSSNKILSAWAEKGYIIETEGSITNYNLIENYIKDIYSNYKVKKIYLDPSDATQTKLNLLNNYNIETEDYFQRTTTMAEPTREIEALVIDKRFKYDGDPVLEWNFANIVVSSNFRDQPHPRRDKNNPDSKIDGAIATIIALGGYIKNNEHQKVLEPTIYIF